MGKPGELINILIKNKLLSQEKLAEIKNSADFDEKNFEDILIKKGVVDIEDLTKAKAEVLNLPYKNLFGEKIKEESLNIISREVAENYKIICFDKIDRNIKVGIVDFDNFKAREAVDFLAKEENLKVEYYLISSSSFNYALKQYKTLDKEITTALESKAQEESEELVKVKRTETATVEDVTKSAPVAKIVSVIIRHAVEGRASDIHIEPLERESRVRYRIDGVLHNFLTLPKNVHGAIVGRIKVMANLKLDETRIPQDGRIRLAVNSKEIDLRVSVLPLMGDEKVAMRILDITKGAPSLEDLGFAGIGFRVIQKNMKKTDGIFLVTGPTGSGKSTTLFSVLNQLNKEGVNIVTLEDPVEYFIKGVNQSLVRPEVGFTFASGLRSLLRQDPDIIMVGEIRDNETAGMAIHAGLTGHFVLSTLHTNDAVGAIPRFLDMKVEPFLLSSTLNIVIAQRLGRKICFHCKSENKLPGELIAGIKEELDKIPKELINESLPDFNPGKMKFFKGRGCPRCGNTGYMGRIALAEVLDITDEIREIIADHKRILTLEYIVENQKFITMKQDGIIKALKGLTAVEDVLSTVHS